MQLYKTKKLIENGVNFNAIYTQKQSKVKEITGLSFSLANIVTFLKEQTDNFTVQNSLAFDVDAQIYSIYTKWLNETDNAPRPVEEPESVEPENEDVKKLMLEISDLNELLEMEDDEGMIKKIKTEISDLNELVELSK
jgi:hypothetical protein